APKEGQGFLTSTCTHPQHTWRRSAVARRPLRCTTAAEIESAQKGILIRHQFRAECHGNVVLVGKRRSLKLIYQSSLVYLQWTSLVRSNPRPRHTNTLVDTGRGLPDSGDTLSRRGPVPTPRLAIPAEIWSAET